MIRTIVEPIRAHFHPLLSNIDVCPRLEQTFGNMIILIYRLKLSAVRYYVFTIPIAVSTTDLERILDPSSNVSLWLSKQSTFENQARCENLNLVILRDVSSASQMQTYGQVLLSLLESVESSPQVSYIS